jgi:hypothetical protein
MSASVTTDRSTREITVRFDLEDAKSLGEFLLEPGHDPQLGHRLLVACADLDGYGSIVDRRPPR